MGERTRAQEYDTLRNEILQLAGRAHDIWRWGLISMLAIYWPIRSAIIEIVGESKLTAFVESHGVLYTIALCVPPAVVAVVMSYQRLKTEEEMLRFGAYLAVFHDKKLSSSFNKDLGWHVWNRIDKCLDPDKAAETTSRKRRIHGGHMVYLLVLLFIVGSTLVMVYDAGTVAMCKPVISGVIVYLVVALLLIWLDWENARDDMKWNRRWATLSQLSKADVDNALRHIFPVATQQ